MSEIISLSKLAQITASALVAERYSVVQGTNYLVVDMRAASPPLEGINQPACVVIGLGAGTPAQPIADVMAADDDALSTLIAAIDQQPVAAATLAQVLRHNESASIKQGLLAESLAYSTLQSSSGFIQWLASSSRPAKYDDDMPPVNVHRDQQHLTLTLNRPAVHNAYSAGLKDALCEGLWLAHTDPSIKQVCLQGNGASFSAGGDLAEFGDSEDSALAHLSRTTRSAAMLLGTLTCQSSAILHGACIGAGIELPAFTQHVSAHPDAFFQLPEVAMGLIPGAGGTVSITKRIGRQQTAYLALSNQRIDAPTALSWGLIDAVDEISLDHAT